MRGELYKPANSSNFGGRLTTYFGRLTTYRITVCLNLSILPQDPREGGRVQAEFAVIFRKIFVSRPRRREACWVKSVTGLEFEGVSRLDGGFERLLTEAFIHSAKRHVLDSYP